MSQGVECYSCLPKTAWPPTCDVDYILVDNEKEALALENNLIKQYKPRFNILLRDDKTYKSDRSHVVL